MTSSTHVPLVGAHTSAAGGAHNALLEGEKIGATTIQLFTSNQRQWKSKKLAPEEIELWQKTLKETGLRKIMSHDSYLINLGAPDPENLAKSRDAFRDEVERCLQLGITFLNFHPGSALKDDPQNCLDRIAESMLCVKDLLTDDTTRLLLENTAGQGSNLGYRFEHLAYIIGKVAKQIPVGVCLDTCHLFAAGYDIRTPEAWETTLQEFDRVVGIKHLHAFHVNDSMKELGSHVDRHQSLGEGQIGIEGFRILMQHPFTKDLPKYLETPGGPPIWTTEIALLKSMYK